MTTTRNQASEQLFAAFNRFLSERTHERLVALLKCIHHHSDQMKADAA